MDDRMTEAAERANGQVEELMRRMSAKAVFGEPIEKGDVTLIPVASVMYGFGTGQGWGRKPKEGEEDAPAMGQGQPNEGAGAGGGGGGAAKPIGYIKIDAKGAHWQPALDIMRLSLSGMFLFGWIMYWGTRVARAGIKLAELEAKRKG